METALGIITQEGIESSNLRIHCTKEICRMWQFLCQSYFSSLSVFLYQSIRRRFTIVYNQAVHIVDAIQKQLVWLVLRKR